MSAGRVRWTERAAWVLILGGFSAGGLAYAVLARDPDLGWMVATVAAGAVIAGIGLLWLRSRMADPP